MEYSTTILRLILEKQRSGLVRARNENDCLEITAGGKPAKLTIEGIELKTLNSIERSPITLFMKCELHELPALKLVQYEIFSLLNNFYG